MQLAPLFYAPLLAESTYQVRRLAPHPSVVLYDSCNECGLVKEFYDSAQQVLQQLVLDDISRIVWPASPSIGWQDGVTAESLPTAFGVLLVYVFS